MAKIKAKIRQKSKLARTTLPFGRKNYYLFAAALLTILGGYIALSQGPADSYFSLSVAPIFLVLGYCVLIPLAILYPSEEGADRGERQAGD